MLYDKIQFEWKWNISLVKHYLVVLCTNLRRFLDSTLLVEAVNEQLLQNAFLSSSISEGWPYWYEVFVVSTEGDEFKDEGKREFMCKVVATDDNEDGGGLVIPSSYSVSKSHVFELIWRLLIWIVFTKSDWWLWSSVCFKFLCWFLDLEEDSKVGRLDEDGQRRLANITPLTPPPPHVLKIQKYKPNLMK